jgi:hypothetical protein
MLARTKGGSLRILAITLAIALAVLCLTLPSSLAQKGGHGGGSSRTSTKAPKAPKTPKIKIAKAPKAPKAPKVAKAPKIKTESSSKCEFCARDKHGKIKRSKEATRAFQRQNPCPSTGKTTGKCSGYVIDHVKPLANGGTDDPSNMQWQTKEAAKAKDKTERKH